MIVSLNKISVITFSTLDPLIYVASAVILSQMIAIVFLALIGKAISRVINLVLRVTLLVSAYGISNLVANKILELLFNAWSLELVTPSTWQALISVIFSTLIFLGSSWVVHLITGNMNQVSTADGIVDELFRERQRLIQIVNDGRNFAGRELSLEVQASRSALESLESNSGLTEESSADLEALRQTLSKVGMKTQASTSSISNRASGPSQISRKYYLFNPIIDYLKRENSFLPISMALISLFGFGTWLGYFVDARGIVLWGSTLSLVGYGVFWTYVKLLAPRLVRLPIVFRILFFEVLLIFYLFFWFLLLGFIAGDNSSSYSVALANAIAPFLLFNGAAAIGGVLNSTQIYRAELLVQTSELRISLMELEATRNLEEDIWKSLFAGDIVNSPTTASVMLNDLSVAGDTQKISEALPGILAIWNSVETKLQIVGNQTR